MQDKDCINMDSLNCATTEDGKNCTTCKASYLLTEGVCTSLDDLQCQTKSTEEEACTVCKPTHILSEGVCKSLATLNCNAKNPTSEQCSSCKTGCPVFTEL